MKGRCDPAQGGRAPCHNLSSQASDLELKLEHYPRGGRYYVYTQVQHNTSFLHLEFSAFMP